MRWLGLFALVACGGKDEVSGDDGNTGGDADADTDTDTDSDTDADCTATVTATDPPDGTLGVAVDGALTAEFSEPVAEDQVSVGIDGVTGVLSVATDGLSATFTPDVFLDEDTTYDFSASVCDSTLGGSFTTAGGGVDAETIEGRTYGIRWDSLTFTEPDPFVIGLIPVDIVHILVAVQSYEPLTDELICAAATDSDDGSGNLTIGCDSALTGVVADFTANPMFQVGPQDFVIGNDPNNPDDDYIVEDLLITGTFSNDSSQILNPHITGAMDVRPFGLGDCAQFVAFGVTCTNCNDGEPQCAVIDASAISANDLTASVDMLTTCGF
jgi:hypothetical protein